MSQNISFRDFVPGDKTRMLAVSRSYESMTDVVGRANEWIAAAGVTVVSVETLLLPGTPKQAAETPTYVELNAGAISVGQWHQVIRVWYRGG